MARVTISLLMVLMVVLCFTLRSDELVITTSRRDLNGDGSPDTVRLIMTSGRFLDDTEDWWCGAGRKFVGQFTLEVRLAGQKAVRTSLNKLFYPELPEQEMWFLSEEWELQFGDFNHDGHLDFTVGQYGSCNTWDYKLFTIKTNGVVVELPVLGESGGVANGHSGMSTAFDGYEDEEGAKDGFYAGFFNSFYGAGETRRYAWKAKQGAFVCVSHQVGQGPWEPVEHTRHE